MVQRQVKLEAIGNKVIAEKGGHRLLAMKINKAKQKPCKTTTMLLAVCGQRCAIVAKR